MVTIYKFILFVYLNYVKEDWSTWTKFGKIIIYPFWWVRSFFVWAFCFIFLPAYWYDGSNLQKEINLAMEKLENTKLTNGKTD